MPRPSDGIRTRICLITPGHLSTNPRIIKEADAFSDAGYDVCVIAADYVDWARRGDAEFANRQWDSGQKIRFGPDAPRTEYLRQSIRWRANRRLAKAIGLRQRVVESAIHPAAADLKSAAVAYPADLYVAHYTAALPAAAAAAEKHRALFAFDAEDFHPGDLPNKPEYDFDRGLIGAIERRLLPHCAYISAASPGIADAYSNAYDVCRPTVILNVFPRAYGPREPNAVGTAAPRPSVYWVSQTIGANRGLLIALEAISLCKSRPYLYIRGTLAKDYGKILAQAASKLGVTERIRLLDPEPPSTMARLASEYDVGLASDIPETENRKIALSNKLFIYLLGGIPVAASSIPAHIGLPSMGDAVEFYRAVDPHDMAAALDRLLLDPAHLAKARRAAWQLAQDRYNWDIEKQILLSMVGRVTAGATKQKVLVP